MSKVAFIGLGNMGLPMAINLAKAGHHINAFDTQANACQAAKEAGMHVTDNVADAARDADYIITMLPNGAIMLSVFAEVIPTANKGCCIIDCSTVDVSSARQAHEMATAAGLYCLDSPVSGGITGAQAGSLTLMIGGETEAYNKAKPILEIMGGRLVHCGQGGAGQSAKICNNMLLGVTMIGLSEAFALAEKLKLDKQALYDVISTSSGSCWSITNYCPEPNIGSESPADHDYKAGFAAELMLKDLSLAQQAAAETNTATPMGQKATAFYKDFVEQGMGKLDFSAVIKQLKAMERG